MANYIERVWTLSSELALNTEFYRWDAGSEIWELKDNTIFHYRVISRNFINKENTELKEILELLPESVLPFELFSRNNLSKIPWTFSEKIKQDDTKQMDDELSTSDTSWEWSSISEWIPPHILNVPYQSSEIVE
jgi:hypothetical protein